MKTTNTQKEREEELLELVEGELLAKETIPDDVIRVSTFDGPVLKRTSTRDGGSGLSEDSVGTTLTVKKDRVEVEEATVPLAVRGNTRSMRISNVLDEVDRELEETLHHKVG